MKSVKRKPVCRTCFQEMVRGYYGGAGSGVWYACNSFMWHRVFSRSLCPQYNKTIDYKGQSLAEIEDKTLPLDLPLYQQVRFEKIKRSKREWIKEFLE